MRIGVDVDGVLTDLQQYIIDNGLKFFGKDKQNLDISYDKIEFSEIFNCSKEEQDKFWLKYIWKYCLKEPIVSDASEVLNLLQRKGNEIHIITKRANTLKENTLGDIFRKMLIDFFKRNNIKPDSINYCDDFGKTNSKKDVCEKLNIDVMIEDDPENISILSEVCNVICVNHKYNENYDFNSNVTRVNSFKEIYGLLMKDDVKNNLELLDNMKFYKDPYTKSYNNARIVGVPLFKAALKPTIIGEENIPKEGSLLLCGNHLHVWDQFPCTCATNRTTHWMAKKEYFEGKMAPFFRDTGAISVDRYGNPKNAVLIAENYLEIGSAVGLFPEGTRNHPKKEVLKEIYDKYSINKLYNVDEFYDGVLVQNPLTSRIKLLEKLYQDKKIDLKTFRESMLCIESTLQSLVNSGELSNEIYDDSALLPFKYGAVSMAKKTDSTIVPFAVTGDYRIGNDNLIISFGEGFKVANKSLEEANQELRENILNLIKNNKNRMHL